MKKYWACVPVMAILFSCQSELNETEARQLIVAENKYPLQLQESIYLNDPEYVRRVTASGLIDEGYLIKNKVTLEDLNTPMISLSETAMPFRISSSNEPKTEVVKVAIEDIKDLSLRISGDTAYATYTTSLRDTTPFVRLFEKAALLKEKTEVLINQNGAWTILK